MMVLFACFSLLLSAGTGFPLTQKMRITVRNLSTLGTHYSSCVCNNDKERANCFTTEVPTIHIQLHATAMTTSGCVAN